MHARFLGILMAAAHPAAAHLSGCRFRGRALGPSGKYCGHNALRGHRILKGKFAAMNEEVLMEEWLEHRSRVYEMRESPPLLAMSDEEIGHTYPEFFKLYAYCGFVHYLQEHDLIEVMEVYADIEPWLAGFTHRSIEACRRLRDRAGEQGVAVAALEFDGVFHRRNREWIDTLQAESLNHLEMVTEFLKHSHRFFNRSN